MWTCRLCENSNPDWLEKCECCGATRPIVDYVPKPMMVEKPQPKPSPRTGDRPAPPPKPKPPLDIVEEGEVVELSKSGHAYITEDGRVGVPKGTKSKSKVISTTRKRPIKRGRKKLSKWEKLKRKVKKLLNI